MKKNFRAHAFHLRGGIWAILFFVILFGAAPTPCSMCLGLPFIILGQLLRFWAVGCIRRYRGEKVGAEKLTTWGPYAFVRNPLYVGNGLIGLGWGIMAGFWPAVTFVLAFILLYVIMIVPHEESFLTEKFGEEYLAYRASTGAFFPKKWPTGRIKGAFDRSILWISERYSFAVTAFGTTLIIIKGFYF